MLTSIWKDLVDKSYLPNVSGLYEVPFYIEKNAKKLVDLTVGFTPINVDHSAFGIRSMTLRDFL